MRKGKHCLTFANIVHESNKSWVIDDGWNSIFCINRQMRGVQYFDFPKLWFSTGQSYIYIAKWEEKIILIPQCGSIPLYIIDHQEHRLLYIFKNKGDIVQNMVQKENILYIFFNNPDNPCVKFDIETEKAYSDIKFRNSMRGRYCNTGRAVIDDGMIWTILRNTNYFVSMAFDKKDICVYEIGDGVSYDYGFSVKDGMCYAIANGGDLLVCASVNDIYNGVAHPTLYEIKNYLHNRSYTDLWASDDAIWLFGGNEENICKFRLSDYSFTEIKMPENFRWNRNKRFHSGVRFTCVEEREDFLFFYPRCSNGILVINTKSNMTQCIPLDIDMGEIIRCQATEVAVSGLDSAVCDNMEFLFSLLSSTKGRTLSPETSKNMIGKSIYDFIVRQQIVCC